MIDRFAMIGATPGGGVRRLTGSTEDGVVRELFVTEAQARGAEIHIDRIGNTFATFRLAPGSDTAVLTGSHLDSQPTGGRFDGALGVIASLLAAESVAERLKQSGAVARHNLTVVNWTNEEGARYQPSLTGSSVFIGTMPLDRALAMQDRNGIKLADELDRIGFRGTEDWPLRPVHYLELHVEQGGRLEAEEIEIGLVHESWSTAKLTIAFLGEPSHTGPTPMPKRRDAMRAAAFAITRFHEVMDEAARDRLFHWSAARIVVEPDSPNVVASRVTVWFEIRNRDEATVRDMGQRFLAAIRPEVARQQIGLEMVAEEVRPRIRLDAAGLKVLGAAAQSLGKTTLDMETITGHDALAVQSGMPGTLFFVPSVGGLSHNEAEFTKPADIENGLAVMEAALWQMVLRPEGERLPNGSVDPLPEPTV